MIFSTVSFSRFTPSFPKIGSDKGKRKEPQTGLITEVGLQISKNDNKPFQKHQKDQWFHFHPTIAIPSGSYRAQKPPKAGNTRKNYEKKLQNPPHPGWAPKIRKNYRKKIQKYFQGIFVSFRYFFRSFGAQPGVGDFVFFS